MKRIIKLSLAAAAMLAVMCSEAWAARHYINERSKVSNVWRPGNEYIVTGNVTIGDRIRVIGSVTLILNDGCVLEAKQGIDVPYIYSLTIKAGGPGGTGKLIATGAEYTAGIGGGKNISGGNITIEGGTVTATGGDCAAGIGGGGERGRSGGVGDGGNIKILGGTVTANGGWHGAGIGGGYYGGGGTLTITGGTIYAKGGERAAGIGGGWFGKGGNVTINGGRVTATGGERAVGIGGDRSWVGTLSSGANGSAWISASSVNADRTGFTSGVLFAGLDGAVYGDQTIDKNVDVPSGKTLKIENGRKLTIAAGKTLKVNKGATLTLESGGHLVNDGTIVNDGLVRLPEGSDLASFGLSKTDSGVVEIGGKAVTKEPTSKEKKAAKKVIDKIKGADSAASSLHAADADPMEAEVKEDDILFDFDEEIVEGSLCTMRIKVEASPDQYAIIANGQMVDVAPGGDLDDEDAKGESMMRQGKIVYVDRFVAPKDAANTSDIELDEVSIEDEGAAELDATLVVFNGKASEKVQAMPEYTPSGLVDGQGLAVFYDDEFEMYVLVVFDGDPDDGLATDIIYAKEVAEETPQRSSSGGACATGAAAVVAIAALAVMKRRKK